MDRTAIFIDGANLYAASRMLGFDMDYSKMRTYFEERYNVVRIFYYTAVYEDNPNERDPLRPLIDWLSYNGFHMVTKKAKVYTDANGRERTKGNMDIELAIDMMDMAPYIEHVILLSGDGDFRKLIESVQRKGIKATVISTIQSRTPMIADELRRQSDVFIDLIDLRQFIERHHERKE